MKVQLKEAIMAQCQELVKEDRDQCASVEWNGDIWPLQYFTEFDQVWYQFGTRHHTVCYKFGEVTSEASVVWGLMAPILGIDQPEARVSDTLLWKAFKFGQENTPLIGQAEFEAWLASLPADPLKADRELVAKYLGICTIAFEHSFSIEVPNMSEALALRASISRLSGLEVPNV